MDDKIGVHASSARMGDVVRRLRFSPTRKRAPAQSRSSKVYERIGYRVVGTSEELSDDGKLSAHATQGGGAPSPRLNHRAKPARFIRAGGGPAPCFAPVSALPRSIPALLRSVPATFRGDCRKATYLKNYSLSAFDLMF